MKVRKRPVIVEAQEWKGNNFQDLLEFAGEALISHDHGSLVISTKEGFMKAKLGDFIIKGVENEIYPCDRNIFNKTYEEVLE